jgi:hypothetical protein
MCTKHPKYKAVHRPQAACLECWEDYFNANPNKVFTSKEMKSLVCALYTTIQKHIEEQIKDHQDAHPVHLPEWV